MSIDQLTAEALSLPPEERETLAQKLWESIDDQEELDLEPEYMREVLRRVEELRSGKVVGIPWEEVLASARREIGCD